MTPIQYEVCEDVREAAENFTDLLSTILGAEFGATGFHIDLVQDYVAGDENGWRVSAYVRHAAESPRGCHTSRHARSMSLFSPMRPTHDRSSSQ